MTVLWSYCMVARYVITAALYILARVSSLSWVRRMVPKPILPEELGQQHWQACAYCGLLGAAISS